MKTKSTESKKNCMWKWIVKEWHVKHEIKKKIPFEDQFSAKINYKNKLTVQRKFTWNTWKKKHVNINCVTNKLKSVQRNTVQLNAVQWRMALIHNQWRHWQDASYEIMISHVPPTQMGFCASLPGFFSATILPALYVWG